VVFFRTADGSIISQTRLRLNDLNPDEPAAISSVAVEKAAALVGVGLANGYVQLFRHVYRVSFPDDQRVITPGLEYPLGEGLLAVDDRGHSLRHLAVQNNEEQATVVAITDDQRVVLSHFAKEVSFLDDEVSLERSSVEIDVANRQLSIILLDKEQRNLYLADDKGQLLHFDVSDKMAPVLLQQRQLTARGVSLTQLTFLAGHVSLLVGDSRGVVTQWFNVRNADNQPVLTEIRHFNERRVAVQAISSEYYRKGFVTVDANGLVALYHTTANRQLLTEDLGAAVSRLAISPRASALLIQDAAGQLHFWRIDNEYPEVSWSVLWGKVWYEGYPEPDYIWQSSASNNDFEPKFSLAPLAFGTLKAAFYAMLLAMPLAIMGAIYTAYFMAPRMRQLVKPGIEIMEALPTVILGFLAGLWLAPFLEDHLAAVFAMLFMLPSGVLVFAYAWQFLPAALRHRIPEGWDAAILVPVILLLAWLALILAQPVELWLFDGSMRQWIETDLGIAFDQRNSVVVGLAMGFAVIPTIFSMAEDAIFSVPKHLRNGSLALGASQWQTLMKVVLLTASPGIFAAIMIGMGRAVGETMIVLMATGNTAVMDFSIFQGMRTLSANIAVEMPETEVGSSHYRILFLAALVLFMFTFVFNTLGELVRQRLRTKYSNL
jgi:phosphate transport system permease protein